MSKELTRTLKTQMELLLSHVDADTVEYNWDAFVQMVEQGVQSGTVQLNAQQGEDSFFMKRVYDWTLGSKQLITKWMDSRSSALGWRVRRSDVSRDIVGALVNIARRIDVGTIA